MAAINMSQQYSLRWNNHQPNFISMFTTLLNTQTLVDVTLAAEGKQLQAHKVVLSACSTYFQALFMDNPSRHPIVILKDVTFADLRIMIDFMYYGEVNVTEEQLPQVLDTAKTLKIKGLTEMPDTTSLTRAPGTSADFQSPGDSIDSQRHSTSPVPSPSSNKRKCPGFGQSRRRKSSTGSTQLNMVSEDRGDEGGPSVDLVRGDAITLSSVPQQRRREYQDDRAMEGVQQVSAPATATTTSNATSPAIEDHATLTWGDVIPPAVLLRRATTDASTATMAIETPTTISAMTQTAFNSAQPMGASLCNKCNMRPAENADAELTVEEEQQILNGNMMESVMAHEEMEQDRECEPSTSKVGKIGVANFAKIGKIGIADFANIGNLGTDDFTNTNNIGTGGFENLDNIRTTDFATSNDIGTGGFGSAGIASSNNIAMAGFASNIGTAGFGTAGFASNIGTAGFASNIGSSGFASNIGSAGFAGTNDTGTAEFDNITNVGTADFANMAPGEFGDIVNIKIEHEDEDSCNSPTFD